MRHVSGNVILVEPVNNVDIIYANRQEVPDKKHVHSLQLPIYIVQLYSHPFEEKVMIEQTRGGHGGRVVTLSPPTSEAGV